MRMTMLLPEFFQVKQSRARRSMHSTSYLDVVIQPACNRADHSECESSLVLFDFGKDLAPDVLRHVAQVIMRRVCSTDEVACFQENRIRAVLPDTPVHAAWKFAVETCQLLALSRPDLVFEVYTYPSGWLPSDQNAPGALPSHRDTPMPSSHVSSMPASSTPSQGSRATSTVPPCMPQKQQAEKSWFGRYTPVWKRGMDIVGSLLGIVMLSPLFFLIAVAIKVTSSGPVLFKQKRIGLLAKPFILWKFRTMEKHADVSLHQQHLEKLINSNSPMTKLEVSYDPRITPLGKLLRQLCLDELPQLVNVLRGEMSLVGPRPDPLYALEYYLPDQKERFSILPGMTGLWQVSGKNNNTFKEMIDLDLIYAKKRSIWLDVKILTLTIPMIIKQIISITKK